MNDERAEVIQMLCRRDSLFARAYAIMGDDGFSWCYSPAARGPDGIIRYSGEDSIRDGDWCADRVRARLCPWVDDLTWFCLGIHLEAARRLTWCVYAAPDTTTDAWRDDVWDGYWAEASITAEGVLSLAGRGEPHAPGDDDGFAC